MKKIQLRSFAKINLTLDVKGILENGFHNVAMILQQIDLCDDVTMQWDGSSFPQSEKGPIAVRLRTSESSLPVDERNLAYKAALIMIERFGNGLKGTIDIEINKRIPIAAGLAGGSGNGAAVLHGLNQLWELDLSLKDLCSLGAQLGSDVPFCIMGQAAADEILHETFSEDPLACHCAFASGTGTDLTPVAGLKSYLVLSKPSISISTAEVYRGIDKETITHHPDNMEMIRGLETENMSLIEKNMINVLENFTLKSYPIVMYTKNMLQHMCAPERVMMSGSGPTVFCLCDDPAHAEKIYQEISTYNRESFLTRTTW